MRLKMLYVPAALAALTMTACSGTTVTRTISDHCIVDEPMRGNRQHDTPKTMELIDEHNRVWDELCL